ncbi:hypothetical protein ACHAW5_005484 [Stephanodiscus triporus]|uniref:Uncharacterized protein n=1 Tax=Stephanodiscus triporus TaxID=2934178 RepID=A0ABD3PP66_9STRA
MVGVGGMLFGGGVILPMLIERAAAKSNNASVLQFWFNKVPLLQGLVVLPALTITMISGTGLSIVQYATNWTLIAFQLWLTVNNVATQGTAIKAVERMYKCMLNREDGLETPKVVVDRHFSNEVSCFFILTLYSIMVLKPRTLIPFPWPFKLSQT